MIDVTHGELLHVLKTWEFSEMRLWMVHSNQTQQFHRIKLKKIEKKEIVESMCI